jgi:hypothetical protein
MMGWGSILTDDLCRNRRSRKRRVRKSRFGFPVVTQFRARGILPAKPQVQLSEIPFALGVRGTSMAGNTYPDWIVRERK